MGVKGATWGTTTRGARDWGWMLWYDVGTWSSCRLIRNDRWSSRLGRLIRHDNDVGLLLCRVVEMLGRVV